MSKLDKKIISIFLLIILLISQFSIVFAADYAGQETKKTLTQYLIENGVDENEDNVLSDAEWAKVKNLNLDGEDIDISGIEKAVNLKSLSITWINPALIDFSKYTKLEELRINFWDYPYEEKVNLTFPKMDNLKYLNISTRSRDKLLENLDISKLSNLKYLYLMGTYSTNILFPSLDNIISMSINVNSDELELDLRKSKDLSYIMIDCADTGSDDIANYPNIQYNNLVACEADMYNLGVCFEKIEKTVEVIKGEETYYFAWIDSSKNCFVNFENDSIIELSSSKPNVLIAKETGSRKVTIKDYLEKTHEFTVNVIEKEEYTKEEFDTTLENTGITAELVADDIILKSNGELWQVNSATTAEKIETNVKNYVSGYVYGTTDNVAEVYVKNILDLNNKLTISCDYDEFTKEISNVKDIGLNTYLTTDGNLYGIYASYITESISTKHLMENVKDIMGEDYIIKEDGTTWKRNTRYDHGTLGYNIEYSKIFDFEIKDYTWKYRQHETYGYWSYADIVIDKNDVEWIYYDNTWREVNESDVLMVQQDGRYLSISKAGDAYLTEDSSGSRDMVDEEEILSSPLILTSIADNGRSYGGDLLVRTDGTIWLYSLDYGLVKITKSTPSIETEIPEDKVDSYIVNERIKEKEITSDISGITGISVGKSVEKFIIEGNFASDYSIQITDSKGNVVASSSLMGTGLKVKLVDESGQVVQEYTVIVYGDTDGDGSINAFDALTLIKGINKKVAFKGEEYKEAGRIMTEGNAEPSAVDALAIVKAANNKYTINQSK